MLLSLLNAGALSAQQCATVLGLSPAHCRTLARQLVTGDVAQALLDKREGQRRDYRVGPEQKAELIQQLAARAITGHSTSSTVLAEQVNARTQAGLSARTVLQCSAAQMDVRILTKQLLLLTNLLHDYVSEVSENTWAQFATVLVAQYEAITALFEDEPGPNRKHNAQNALAGLKKALHDHFFPTQPHPT